jgi:hypothetical protein
MVFFQNSNTTYETNENSITKKKEKKEKKKKKGKLRYQKGN